MIIIPIGHVTYHSPASSQFSFCQDIRQRLHELFTVEIPCTGKSIETSVLIILTELRRTIQTIGRLQHVTPVVCIIHIGKHGLNIKRLLIPRHRIHTCSAIYHFFSTDDALSCSRSHFIKTSGIFISHQCLKIMLFIECFLVTEHLVGKIIGRNGIGVTDGSILRGTGYCIGVHIAFVTSYLIIYIVIRLKSQPIYQCPYKTGCSRHIEIFV